MLSFEFAVLAFYFLFLVFFCCFFFLMFWALFSFFLASRYFYLAVDGRKNGLCVQIKITFNATAIY